MMQFSRLPLLQSARTLHLSIALSIIVTTAACTNSGGKQTAPASGSPAGKATVSTQASNEAAGPALPELKINPQRAMQYVNEIVAIGPRPVGSAGHKKVEAYIREHLKGVQVEDDVFTSKTPAGSFEMKNIIAKFRGNRDGVIVLASHYDTVYPLGK